jgi:hypothetical protein
MFSGMLFSTEKSAKSFDEGKVVKMVKKWPPPNICVFTFMAISQLIGGIWMSNQI